MTLIDVTSKRGKTIDDGRRRIPHARIQRPRQTSGPY